MSFSSATHSLAQYSSHLQDSDQLQIRMLIAEGSSSRRSSLCSESVTCAIKPHICRQGPSHSETARNCFSTVTMCPDFDRFGGNTQSFSPFRWSGPQRLHATIAERHIPSRCSCFPPLDVNLLRGEIDLADLHAKDFLRAHAGVEDNHQDIVEWVGSKG